jgi:potassium-dependent mechanosensitive channel
MNQPYAVAIMGFPQFREFTVAGAQMLLDAGEVTEYLPGQVVIKEGDEATFVLLVLSGKLQVFVERHGRELALTEPEPGTIVGELAVLCGMPRSASLRAIDKSAVLKWHASVFRSLLLRNVFFAERIFRESLRGLIEKERSLIEAVIESQAGTKESDK